MQKMTKAEEEIMQALWVLERATVGEIRNWLEVNIKDEKPAHSTTSTLLRIMGEKGFVGYNAYGRTFEYYPLISKDDYSRRSLDQMVDDYFSGSAAQLVSFLVRDEKLSDAEIAELRKMLEGRG
jgi:BlaI family transcriptional regulator, penicillinase repressor